MMLKVCKKIMEFSVFIQNPLFSDRSTGVDKALQIMRAVFQPDGPSLPFPIQMYSHLQSPPLHTAYTSRPHCDAYIPVCCYLLHTLPVARCTVVTGNGLCNFSTRTHVVVSYDIKCAFRPVGIDSAKLSA